MDNGAPLYGQILSQLEKAVLSGDYPLHAVLPGEKELSERFGVSRITAKRALNELAAKGLVRRMRGRGTVVVYNAALPVVKGSFDNLLQSLTVMGLETELELVSVEMEPSSEEVQIA
ncbi:MAG: GntR family transcriptional regulator, partial [Pseudomonadota bacterium]